MPFDILFTTSRFNLSEVQEHFINPSCFGNDLAEWLRSKLLQRGIPTIEPDQEDWGWYIESTYGNDSYFIGIGGNSDEISSAPNQGEWRLMIEKHRSVRDRLTGKNALTWDEPFIPVIRDILEHEADFENIHYE